MQDASSGYPNRRKTKKNTLGRCAGLNGDLLLQPAEGRSRWQIIVPTLGPWTVKDKTSPNNDPNF